MGNEFIDSVMSENVYQSTAFGSNLYSGVGKNHTNTRKGQTNSVDSKGLTNGINGINSKHAALPENNGDSDCEYISMLEDTSKKIDQLKNKKLNSTVKNNLSTNSINNKIVNTSQNLITQNDIILISSDESSNEAATEQIRSPPKADLNSSSNLNGSVQKNHNKVSPTKKVVGHLNGSVQKKGPPVKKLIGHLNGSVQNKVSSSKKVIVGQKKSSTNEVPLNESNKNPSTVKNVTLLKTPKSSSTSIIKNKPNKTKANETKGVYTFKKKSNLISNTTTRKLRTKLDNSFAGYFYEDGSTSSSTDSEKNEKETQESSLSLQNKSSRKNKIKLTPTNTTINNKRAKRSQSNILNGIINREEKNICEENEIRNESTKPIELFETIYVDALNYDESNSEKSSPTPKKKAEVEKHITQNGISKNHVSKKKSLPRSRKKSNVNVKLRKFSKKINEKLKLKEHDLKSFKVNVKRLRRKQINVLIKNSKLKMNKRRRSWSPSDVAREHDRRLNFFPEPGPSHVDYYALIKLPVVKPKVPIS